MRGLRLGGVCGPAGRQSGWPPVRPPVRPAVGPTGRRSGGRRSGRRSGRQLAGRVGSGQAHPGNPFFPDFEHVKSEKLN